MGAPQDVIQCRQDGPTLTFRVQGCGTMAQALAVRRVAEQGLAAGVTALRVELHGCTHLDSTFLGTLLLLLKRATGRCGAGGFALVSPSTACERLFRQMGAADLFPTAAEAAAPGPWAELTRTDPAGGGPGEVAAFKCNVVQAHQELADLPGPAGEAFRPFVGRLARELDAEKKP
jgi:anti-anti-sigma regulatory factor